MTGELTLTGQVLPVGGIREKVIAAKRVGVHELILPLANQPDFERLPDYVKAGLSASFVKHYKDVAKLVFESPVSPRESTQKDIKGRG
jgi:ATP-dependent Lon protease